MLNASVHVCALLFANARTLAPAPKSMLELLKRVSAPIPGVTMKPMGSCSLSPAAVADQAVASSPRRINFLTHAAVDLRVWGVGAELFRTH